MSSIAEIRHHIRAISETAKITRAMYLISSAKMKKALQAHDQTGAAADRADAADQSRWPEAAAGRRCAGRRR